MKRYLIILALCGAAYAGSSDEDIAYENMLRYERVASALAKALADIEAFNARNEAVLISKDAASGAYVVQQRYPVSEQKPLSSFSRMSDNSEIEEQVESLQAQINAQNSCTIISEGVSRDVQVITPGRIIDLRK